MGEDSDCYDCCLAVFEPHFKRQGNVGYRHAFFFFLLVQFSQIFIFWKANASLHFPGFAQMQTSGRDSLERSSFALSYFTHTHTHTQMLLRRSKCADLSHCHNISLTPICGCLLWGRWRERLLWLLPPIIEQIFLVVFFWEAFLRFLKGAQTSPQKLRTAGPLPTCTPPRSWHPCHRH